MADIDRLLVFGDIHSKWDRFQEGITLIEGKIL